MGHLCSSRWMRRFLIVLNTFHFVQETYRNERFRMVLRRANCDRLDRSSWLPFCPCSKCVCELALPSTMGSMFIEPARELDFSIAAMSSKQLKNDCFCLQQCHFIWTCTIAIFNEYMFCGSFDRPQCFYFFNLHLGFIACVLWLSNFKLCVCFLCSFRSRRCFVNSWRIQRWFAECYIFWLFYRVYWCRDFTNWCRVACVCFSCVWCYSVL